MGEAALLWRKQFAYVPLRTMCPDQNNQKVARYGRNRNHADGGEP